MSEAAPARKARHERTAAPEASPPADRRRRLTLAGLALFASQAAYTFTNHHPLYSPRELALTCIDKAIPLVPWTVFIYLTDLPLCVTAYLAVRGEAARDAFGRAFISVFLFGLGVCVLFPTAYPRDAFPIAEGATGPAAATLSYVRAFDAPTNACPSLHVACCGSAALSFWRAGQSARARAFWLLWATLVAVSTLTTKQHHIADVVAGVTLAIAGHLWARRRPGTRLREA